MDGLSLVFDLVLSGLNIIVLSVGLLFSEEE
jgi:hypothetical protein